MLYEKFSPPSWIWEISWRICNERPRKRLYANFHEENVIQEFLSAILDQYGEFEKYDDGFVISALDNPYISIFM